MLTRGAAGGAVAAERGGAEGEDAGVGRTLGEDDGLAGGAATAIEERTGEGRGAGGAERTERAKSGRGFSATLAGAAPRTRKLRASEVNFFPPRRKVFEGMTNLPDSPATPEYVARR